MAGVYKVAQAVGIVEIAYAVVALAQLAQSFRVNDTGEAA